jgi:alkylation response protein AidB-like acyl-CoA dehydrogenase
MSRFRFDLFTLPAAAEELRREVRDFLATELDGYPPAKRAHTWTGWDPDFTRKVAARGWIGMTWPRQYGGHERSAFERYVVLEEMLASGAPVAAHWIGDRQSGPLLLKFGTEAQRQKILPGVCAGGNYFCIGMSEPDSGSDLASIRSRARQAGDGWLLNGTKVWTTGAFGCDYMIALFRTTVVPDKKHAGLSQFLVPLRSPGITVRPIRDLAGNEHFCEVVFEDALVPADALVGAEGNGWNQVMAELAYERSGPERYLSSYPLLVELVRTTAAAPSELQTTTIGRQVAHLATLRTMATSMAGLLQAGVDPTLEASVLKDIGAVFEQDLPGVAQSLVDSEPRSDAGADDFQRVLAHLTQNAPSFSLRGGTREILRGIIARGLGLR